MNALITVCAYCERTREETVNEAGYFLPLDDALQFVERSGNRVLLCPACRGESPALTEEQQWAILTAPIALPDGITAIEHVCCMLLADGFPEDEATFRLVLETDDDNQALRRAKCVECGMTVESRVL